MITALPPTKRPIFSRLKIPGTVARQTFLGEKSMAGQFVEIRDYTIEPQWWDAYKSGSSTTAPCLKRKFDIIDFLDLRRPGGRSFRLDPKPSPHGQPQVCWIIRWENKAARDAGFAALMKDEEWQAVWAKHPNPNAYLQMNGRFMASV